ncbi:hypothetical protein A3768_0908 [Ralstonia solanacearum]|nr:hypothetical protein A3768_0908 [Ralstonia solanacearum]
MITVGQQIGIGLCERLWFKDLNVPTFGAAWSSRHFCRRWDRWFGK